MKLPQQARSQVKLGNEEKDRFLNLGDAIPCGTRDDGGVRLPFGGRCMVDSIYHNEAAGQFVVTISHSPEVKV